MALLERPFIIWHIWWTQPEQFAVEQFSGTSCVAAPQPGNEHLFWRLLKTWAVTCTRTDSFLSAWDVAGIVFADRGDSSLSPLSADSFDSVGEISGNCPAGTGVVFEVGRAINVLATKSSSADALSAIAFSVCFFSFRSNARTLFSMSFAVKGICATTGSLFNLATSFGYHLFGILPLLAFFAARPSLAAFSTSIFSRSLFFR